MKRFFIKLAVFLGITVAATLALDWLVTRAAGLFKSDECTVNETKRLLVREGKVKYRPGVANILFLGNSRMLFDLIPTEFDRLSGGRTNSWNGGLSYAPVAWPYFTLVDYLQVNPPPDYIVFHLCWRDPGDGPGPFDEWGGLGASPREIWSYYQNRKDKSVALNYLHPARLYRAQTLTYLYNAAFDPGANTRAREQKEKLSRFVLESQGFCYMPDDARYQGPSLDENFTEYEFLAGYDDWRSDPYYVKFFALTREKNIPVLLVEMPSPEFNVKPPNAPLAEVQRQEMPGFYQEIVREFPNVRMTESGWKYKVWPHHYFFDTMHLNGEGAQLCTRTLYQEFTEAFGAP